MEITHHKWIRIIALLLLSSFWFSVAKAQWNNPHQNHHPANTRYAAFSGPPRTLDPARSFSADEATFTAQIYEPPLQYHYLKRPYTLVPLTLTQMPTVTYYNAAGKKLPATVNPKKVAYSTYDLYLKPGIFYQPHPAFAKDANGQYRYHHLTPAQQRNKQTLKDFKHTGTRELVAADYVYQIKRIADPKLNSPINSLMAKHIVGLKAYTAALSKNPALDLRDHAIEGVTAISRYHYRITIKGVYPQFQYWLAMPFFAPIPWEADRFYAQPGMKAKNLTWDWQPVGTGPYQLTENNPNGNMILSRNPNFHAEYYPSTGMPGDKQAGYLEDAGKQLPFVDRFVFTLDKESIPRWNKFLQGYYDKSGIAADSFDQAIQIDRNGHPILTPTLKSKGMRLQTNVEPAVFYIGFNMLDPVIGGYTPQQKKLRQAISIAIDYEEYITIFMNGRGKVAQGPIPPAIFGYQDGPKGINHVVYYWDGKKARRKPLTVAKQLMKAAGYPNGIDPKTGRPLILTFAATAGGPDDKSRFNWLRKQFAKLGIQLNIESTQYNRFQDKIRRGNAQLFFWGWMADYPDPENFLFLLYGANGKVKHGGENAANYANPKFDALFAEIKDMPEGPERLAKINEALHLVRDDSPWAWGFHPIQFTLAHQWTAPRKSHVIANNLLKYEKLSPQQRTQKQVEWNAPILWPLWVFLGFLGSIAIPLGLMVWRRNNTPAIKRKKQ